MGKQKTAVMPKTKKKPFFQRIKKDLKRNWILYMLLLPGLLSLILFKIGPVGGMVIAFEDFSAFKGIFGSEWVGLEHFIQMFRDPYMLKLISNTVILARFCQSCVYSLFRCYSRFVFK